MNEFFKLLRDFVIFIPLGILLFGIFFSLIATTQQNLSFLLIGIVIFLYGLVASYARQFYKDLLSFLRKEQLGNSQYLSKWRKYHIWYYFIQFILLLIFIYVLWYLLFGQNNGLYVFPQIVFFSRRYEFGLECYRRYCASFFSYFGWSVLDLDSKEHKNNRKNG